MYKSYFDVAYIVDDSKLMTKLHSKIVHKLNITKEIKDFCNPIEALKGLVKDITDKKTTLLLLDLDMPNIDGAKFLEIISQLNVDPKKLSVYIISSTLKDHLHKEILYHSFVRRHIAKPLRKKDLVILQLKKLHERNQKIAS